MWDNIARCLIQLHQYLFLFSFFFPFWFIWPAVHPYWFHCSCASTLESIWTWFGFFTCRTSFLWVAHHNVHLSSNFLAINTWSLLCGCWKWLYICNLYRTAAELIFVSQVIDEPVQRFIQANMSGSWINCQLLAAWTPHVRQESAVHFTGFPDPVNHRRHVLRWRFRSGTASLWNDRPTPVLYMQRLSVQPINRHAEKRNENCFHGCSSPNASCHRKLMNFAFCW